MGAIVILGWQNYGSYRKERSRRFQPLRSQRETSDSGKAKLQNASFSSNVWKVERSRAISLSQSAAQQSLAADGAIACLSNSLFQRRSDADRAPQLKAGVGRLKALAFLLNRGNDGENYRDRWGLFQEQK